MKPHDYIKVFQKIGLEVPIWNSVFLILSELNDRDEDILAQKACNASGGSIVEDGIIGQSTIAAIAACDPSIFLINLGSLLMVKKSEKDDKADESSLEETIMTYLAKAEGLHLHWNKGEKDFTTMYGVYAYSFPKSKPVKYIRAIAAKNNIVLNRSNIGKVDSSLTTTERRTLTKMIFQFYLENFMDQEVNKRVGNKSALSFFSNSVNAGMSRGYRALQYAIGTKVDGKFGPASMKKLDAYKNTDKKMNQDMGNSMFEFYKYLARKEKFKRFFRGWVNRLKGLGWVMES